MPLIETVTEPDLLTPNDVRAAGRLLARVVRASGKVRRGPGAARQDVNVSVAGGRRVEIKGVDNHRILPLLVHTEAFRQLNLLRIKAELERRGVERRFFEIPEAGPRHTPPWEQSDLVIDATGLLRSADYEPIDQARERGDTIVAVRLRGFRGLLAHRTQPGITFARELRGRVRVIACLTASPFMIHSDVEDYGLSNRAWRNLRRALRADSGDAIVVLWGARKDAATAAREVLLRALDATEGVPAETRQSYSDGTTGFERILPGPDRMYPDTDTPPLPVEDAWIEKIEASPVETPWLQEARYTAAGLCEASARRLSASPWAPLFDALLATLDEAGQKTVARRLAFALETRLVHFWRESATRALPEAARLAPLVAALAAGRLDPDGFETVLDRTLRESDRDTDALLAEHEKNADAEAQLETLLAEVRDGLGALRAEDDDTRRRWAMGQVMPRLRGRIAPERAAAAVSELLEKAGE